VNRPTPTVHIHYLRPPSRLTVFRQVRVHETPGAIITLAEDLVFDPPLVIDGAVALETGSSAVWFTFPGAWHDIGRFYRRDGTFTGLYANLITPCIFETAIDWSTTDLFLDLWIPAGGNPRNPHLLDRDEFDRAVSAGHLTPRHANAALEEAESLRSRAASGAWPPTLVTEWTLERARDEVRISPRPAPGPNTGG
jgi:predicted RNA-binding protein associated with RNAse of E/G family